MQMPPAASVARLGAPVIRESCRDDRRSCPDVREADGDLSTCRDGAARDAARADRLKRRACRADSLPVSLFELVLDPPRAPKSAPRRLAIVPAFNEAASVGRVIDEIRVADPGFEILVVDDGSTDETAAVARAHRARVVSLPFNLGIGGAVQTGYRYARDHGFELAVQVDGDGQHDPRELAVLMRPVLAGEADLSVGSRFAGTGEYRAPAARRLGIRLFARAISRIAGQPVTDTTSGFRAANRRAIELFADDYPHDYPEVEATVMVVREHLRLVEVPVAMRERAAGRSSITAARSIYYMAKVLVALFVGLFRAPTASPERP
jgi:glycosyltransferase involved in cell wall biosynthesis